MIRIDGDKCKRDGLCLKACCENHVFIQDAPGEIPRAANQGDCSLCGHCVAVCPGDAITHSGMNMSEFKPVDLSAFPTPDAAENFLFSMRSVRQYKKKAVPKEDIARLLAAGSKAASEHNSQDRMFFVLTDAAKIHELSGRLSAHYGMLAKTLRPPVMSAIGVFAPGMKNYLEGSLPDMKRKAVEFGPETDPIFHGAPCLIVITSKKANMLGKDTALTAQETIRVLAHAMGLGTCVSGYAIGAPSIVSKALKIPRGQKIQTVFTLGYPALKYRKTVDRRPPKIDRAGN